MAGETVRVGVIGTGGQAKYVHLDGYARCPQASIVALCDTNTELLAQRAEELGVSKTFTDYRELLAQPDVDAVSICTPNVVHKEIAIAAVRQGKHVLCEKPIAMSYADAREMADAAERAGVRHMTAFTYRFVPAMRYLQFRVRRGDIGQPTHVRCRRFQDWGDRAIGWRQIKSMAGTGELGDMASHRIDYANALVGQAARATGLLKTFMPERITPDGGKLATDVDDWTAFIVEYESGAVGVFESTKLAFGRGTSSHGLDELEISGPDGAFLYQLGKPHQLLFARPGQIYDVVAVPDEYLTPPGAPEGFTAGDPLVTFRYAQMWEFVTAIQEGRPCVPSLLDGARCQAVMDAVVRSSEERRWVDVPR